jgi:hypothetical protein
MSILNPFRRAVLVCAAMLAMAGMAFATPVTNVFGPIAGTNVSYSGSETDNQSPDPPSPTWLFGTPILGGSNNLHFTSDASQTPKPIQFAVITPGAEQLEDGKLSINANALGNSSIALMSITEGGDYLIANGTSASTADAILNITSAIATVNVGPGNDVQIPLLPFISEGFTTTPNGNPHSVQATAIVFSGNGPLVTGTWQGTANFNISAAVAAAGLGGDRVTKVEFTLDDILLGHAETGALVEITKKDFLITQNPVPEPSSIILGVLGGLGMVTVGLRKKFLKTA